MSKLVTLEVVGQGFIGVSDLIKEYIPYQESIVRSALEKGSPELQFELATQREFVKILKKKYNMEDVITMGEIRCLMVE